MSKKAYIYLEDGSIFEGESFGSESQVSGELVFTTAMNGYPESLTDPSYRGQILVMTHPLVGNYGVPKKVANNGILDNFESEKIAVSGLVVNEITRASKWNSNKDLATWLESEKIPGIFGIDTRVLTKKIRDSGAMMGAIVGSGKKADAKKLLKKNYSSMDLVSQVSPKKPVFHLNGNSRKDIVVVDFGVKHGILSSLHDLGYNIIRVPYSYSASKIIAFKPGGILYSNGPGDPARLKNEAETFREVAEYGIPTLGLCLGHQIAVMAFGGKVRKMKFGHRAINKSVLDVETGKAYITTHNHGYACFREDIPKEMKEWFVSIDDKVVEGTKSQKRKLITTQFHPEARPGTKDARFVFRVFDRMIKDENK